MVGHGGSSAGSYLADPTSPIPSHCTSIVVTSTVRVTFMSRCRWSFGQDLYGVVTIIMNVVLILSDLCDYGMIVAEIVAVMLALTVLVATIDALRHF